MNVYHDVNEIERDDKTVLSVGTFDGVHKAHRQIINKVLQLSKNNKSRSFIVTFEPHPQEVLKNKHPDIKILSTLDEKLSLFESLGIENTLVIKFTMEFSKTSPEEFYESLIYKHIGLSDIVLGYDHGFGKDREGNYQTLLKLGEKLGFRIHREDEIDTEGEPVSSTRIRNYLQTGKIRDANVLLGNEYMLEGRVIEGDKSGRTLGYPTANIKPMAENKVIPGDGIYAVRAVHNTDEYYGMMSIGYRPTLTEGKRKVIEVNLFDYSSDLYGEKLKIHFLEKLRDEVKFKNREELIEQLKEDKENSLKLINKKIKEEN